MKLILAAVAFAASAAMAIAADDPMASRYGNTVVAKTADGKEAGRTYYDADGKYTRKTPAGKSKGTWKIDGANICLTQTEPAPPAGTARGLSSVPGRQESRRLVGSDVAGRHEGYGDAAEGPSVS